MYSFIQQTHSSYQLRQHAGDLTARQKSPGLVIFCLMGLWRAEQEAERVDHKQSMCDIAKLGNLIYAVSNPTHFFKWDFFNWITFTYKNIYPHYAIRSFLKKIWSGFPFNYLYQFLAEYQMSRVKNPLHTTHSSDLNTLFISMSDWTIEMSALLSNGQVKFKWNPSSFSNRYLLHLLSF